MLENNLYGAFKTYLLYWIWNLSVFLPHFGMFGIACHLCKTWFCMIPLTPCWLYDLSTSAGPVHMATKVKQVDQEILLTSVLCDLISGNSSFRYFSRKIKLVIKHHQQEQEKTLRTENKSIRPNNHKYFKDLTTSSTSQQKHD